MRKIYAIIICIFSLCTYSYAQDSNKYENFSRNQLSLGARLGMSSYMPKGIDVSGHLGYSFAADINYIYFFTPMWGLKSGLSANIAQTTTVCNINNVYKTSDALGNVWSYKNTGILREREQVVELQIPIMATLFYKGFFASAGIRLAVPVSMKYNQQLSDVYIRATDEITSTTITNERITGRVQESQLKQSGTWLGPSFKLYVAAEVGYEWKLKNGDGIGVGLYFDYSVYNKFENPYYISDSKVFHISRIAEEESNPCAQVSVHQLSESAIEKWNYLDFGVKVVYNINLKKK